MTDASSQTKKMFAIISFQMFFFSILYSLILSKINLFGFFIV